MVHTNKKKARSKESQRQTEAASKVSAEGLKSDMYMQFWTKDLEELKTHIQNHLVLSQTAWVGQDVLCKTIKVLESNRSPMTSDEYRRALETGSPIVVSGGVAGEGGFGVKDGKLTFTEPKLPNTALSGQS